jgi:hypothetical protein
MYHREYTHTHTHLLTQVSPKHTTKSLKFKPEGQTHTDPCGKDGIQQTYLPWYPTAVVDPSVEHINHWWSRILSNFDTNDQAMRSQHYESER